MQRTDIANPAYFHKVVDCQWACPAHTPVPEYIRLIAQGRYGDAYMINWVSNVFPGILGRTCDRPCEPACRRGRVEENNAGTARAGGHLPPEARRGRHEGRRHAAHAQAGAQERQARRLHRRRAGVADRGARPGAAGLRGDGVRRRGQGRRLHPHADPALPAARVGDRRGDRLHPRPGRAISRRRAHRIDEGADGAGLRRHLRRLRRAARARPGHSRPRGSGRQHPHRHRLAGVGVVRPRHQDRQARDRAGRRQHGDGLLPLGAAAGRRRTSRSSCAAASRR